MALSAAHNAAKLTLRIEFSGTSGMITKDSENSDKARGGDRKHPRITPTQLEPRTRHIGPVLVHIYTTYGLVGGGGGGGGTILFKITLSSF